MKPRSITAAYKMGYKTESARAYNHAVCVTMKPRFYKAGMKAILTFWITYTGAKRLGMNLTY